MSTFLLRSHQAVADHCRILLAAGGLTDEQAEKLTALLREAVAEVERLTSQRAAA
jgi:hypothetical protein